MSSLFSHLSPSIRQSHPVLAISGACWVPALVLTETAARVLVIHSVLEGVGRTRIGQVF